MKRKNLRIFLTISLVFALVFSFAGCSAPLREAGPPLEGMAEQEVEQMGQGQTIELTAGLAQGLPFEGIEAAEEERAVIADFGIRLFQQSLESDKNTLISPLSVISVLGMTAGGAGGETLSQMEEVLGLPADRLHAALASYVNSLPSGEQYRVHRANSIWCKDDGSFAAEQDFLQLAAGWYDGEVFQAPFDDGTLSDINAWVSEHTGGMIEKVLDQVPAEAVMYLVNALSFDAKWQRVYDDYRVREAVFVREDGTQQEIELMHSDEYMFLQDERATGFVKYYADEKYAFAALLPEEGLRIADYAASLTGERLRELLAGAEGTKVDAAIPRFQCEYSVELADILKSMGMEHAFDLELADFSGIGVSEAGNLYINRVLHKAFICVDKEGTRAGAATVSEVVAGDAPTEPKKVILDRPFIYAIVDCETNNPLFIGTVMDMG